MRERCRERDVVYNNNIIVNINLTKKYNIAHHIITCKLINGYKN